MSAPTWRLPLTDWQEDCFKDSGFIIVYSDEARKIGDTVFATRLDQSPLTLVVMAVEKPFDDYWICVLQEPNETLRRIRERVEKILQNLDV